MSWRDYARNGKSIECGMFDMIDPGTSTMENWEFNDRVKH